eukprot:EG_transcript_24075
MRHSRRRRVPEAERREDVRCSPTGGSGQLDGGLFERIDATHVLPISPPNPVIAHSKASVRDGLPTPSARPNAGEDESKRRRFSPSIPVVSGIEWPFLGK